MITLILFSTQTHRQTHIFFFVCDKGMNCKNKISTPQCVLHRMLCSLIAPMIKLTTVFRKVQIFWEGHKILKKIYNLFYVTKGQLISEAIFLALNSSKKRTQYLKLFALATRAEVFRLSFGRIEIKMICFWNYLTFA